MKTVLEFISGQFRLQIQLASNLSRLRHYLPPSLGLQSNAQTGTKVQVLTWKDTSYTIHLKTVSKYYSSFWEQSKLVNFLYLCDDKTLSTVSFWFSLKLRHTLIVYQCCFDCVQPNEKYYGMFYNKKTTTAINIQIKKPKNI